MVKVFLGIDPGAAGGLGKIVVDDNGQRASVFSLKGLTEKDIFQLFKDITPWPQNTFALIERVHAFPVNGSIGNFKLGYSYGALRMALISLGVAFDEVTPQTWQRAMGSLTRGDKRISKQKAEQLFPALKITHAVADCILIAEHCRRTRGGENGDGPPF